MQATNGLDRRRIGVISSQGDPEVIDGPVSRTTSALRLPETTAVGVVSSISASGQPQCALVGIAVTPLLEIVFDTLRTARKYANLVTNPRCSLVIGWQGEQTAQLEGIASQPTRPELEQYQAVYFEAWPDGQIRASWPGIAYFVVRPGWIRYSDYARDPPVVEEFT